MPTKLGPHVLRGVSELSEYIAAGAAVEVEQDGLADSVTSDSLLRVGWILDKPLDSRGFFLGQPP